MASVKQKKYIRRTRRDLLFASTTPHLCTQCAVLEDYSVSILCIYTWCVHMYVHNTYMYIMHDAPEQFNVQIKIYYTLFTTAPTTKLQPPKCIQYLLRSIPQLISNKGNEKRPLSNRGYSKLGLSTLCLRPNP